MRHHSTPEECDRPLMYVHQTSTNQNLDGEDLRYANFRGSNLRGSSFRNADLRDAVFYETNLEDCDFTGAKLDGANLARAEVQGAIFDDCSLNGALLFDPEHIDLTHIFTPKESILGGMVFLKPKGTDLNNSLHAMRKSKDVSLLQQYFDLKSALLGVDIYLDIISVFEHFIGPVHYYAISENVNPKNLWAYASVDADIEVDYENMDLRNACFSNSWIDNVASQLNFHSANLECANLSESSFHHARFTKANLRCALCKNTDFMHSSMSKVCLDGADVSGARFVGCDLTSAKLLNITVDASTSFFQTTANSTIPPRLTHIDANTEITTIQPLTIDVHDVLRAFRPMRDLVSKAEGRQVSEDEYFDVLGIASRKKAVFIYFIENNTNFRWI